MGLMYFSEKEHFLFAHQQSTGYCHWFHVKQIQYLLRSQITCTGEHSLCLSRSVVGMRLEDCVRPKYVITRTEPSFPKAAAPYVLLVLPCYVCPIPYPGIPRFLSALLYKLYDSFQPTQQSTNCQTSCQKWK